MNILATAVLVDGTKIKGRLTTAHPASSYGQPVFVGDDGLAVDWAVVTDLSTAPEQARRAGKVRTPLKSQKSAENGKRGGKPKRKQ